MNVRSVVLDHVQVERNVSMNDIFTSYIAMDCFCYDIIEGWIRYRKRDGLPYDEDSYMQWLDEFMNAMAFNYSDCVEDEDD